MKAWQFNGSHASLQLVDLPDPVPSAGWVVVDVRAAGMCHSDLHIMHGPGEVWLDRTPMVLGHEIAGVISAVGTDVSGFAVGDRVAVGPGPGLAASWAPPNLEHRRKGTDGSLCGRRHTPGLADDGGYAEKCLVHSSKLVLIPEGVSFAAAAVATDAILTAYHAVRSAGRAMLGETVGIIGMGGLGMNGVRTAALCGAKVYGVDQNTAIFEEARQAGATECFTEISSLTDLHPDLIVDFAGTGETTAAALSAVRIGGRVVLVGLASPQLTIDTYSLVVAQVDLQASLGGTMAELAQVYDLIEAGKLSPKLEEVAFDGIEEGFKRLEDGRVTGRLFTDPNAGNDSAA